MIVLNLLKSCWYLLSEMAPYLLLGFFTAGLMHAFIPSEAVWRHLSGNSVKEVMKASLLGVPLPLCSCGVIPVVEHLRREGAGRGAVLAFLISAPTTGVDSILATWSLLGLPITVLRVAASFVAALVAGVLSVLVGGDESVERECGRACCCAVFEPVEEKISFAGKLKEALIYGFFTLLHDTKRWILVGIFLGGLIDVFMPEDFIYFFVRHGFAYPAVLLMAVPMYVCATGSIPVASALIAKGFPPGAAVVFLIAGPATNTVTLSFVRTRLGTKVFFIYLFTVVVVSLIFGFITDALFSRMGWSVVNPDVYEIHTLKSLCAAVLMILFFVSGRLFRSGV